MPFTSISANSATTSVDWGYAGGLTGGVGSIVVYNNVSTSNEQNESVDEASVDIQTPSNTNYTVKRQRTTNADGHKIYSADLVFSFVKSKLTKLEQKEIKARLKNLQMVIQSCAETGQAALADHMLIEQATGIRQQEVAAAGFDTYVTIEDVEKFRHRSKTQIDFGSLEKFPRPIPQRVRNVISAVRRKAIFDELLVLYHNPTREQVTSTKEKVISKDPIVFGRFSYDPGVLYYIVDWIDEVCDLTMEQFVKSLKQADPTFETMHIAPITQKQAEEIKERARIKANLVSMTNRSNYRELAAIENLEHAQFSWKTVRTVLTALRKSFQRSRKNGFIHG
jgi:hypothetical protein